MADDGNAGTSANALWSGFALDPRLAAHSEMRASDSDRDRIHGVLADAFADGRLDRDEYDERSATLLTTRTLGGLPPLVNDLVAEVAPGRSMVTRSSGALDLADASSSELTTRAEREWESQRRSALLGFLGPSLITWAVWIATCFGSGGFEPYFPWPLIVMAATGFRAVRVIGSRQEIVAGEVERLEKKQAKAIEKRMRTQQPGPPESDET